MMCTCNLSRISDPVCSSGDRTCQLPIHFGATHSSCWWACPVHWRYELGGHTQWPQPSTTIIRLRSARHLRISLRVLYGEWTITDNPKAPAGHRRLQLSIACGWTSSARKLLPGEMVHKSFRRCSGRNAADGTDEKALWHVSSQKHSSTGLSSEQSE